MSFEGHIEQLTKSSKSVITDCVVDNGAIVAGNTDRFYYPETAINYRYVWPRDVAFTLYAADTLGLSSDIRANFVQWLLNRAEGFSESGTLIKRYGTNGRHDLGYGQQYQPDQAGAMLWALHHTSQESDVDVDRAITLLANGLSRQWQETKFVHPNDPNTPIQDLWEDQGIPSTESSVFTYSLATAVYGLDQAITRLGDRTGVVSDNWRSATESMREVLQSVDTQPAYPWKIPGQSGERGIDASLSGLVWPFKIAPEAGKLVIASTVKRIGDDLYEPGRGIKRFTGDKYDGVLSANTPPTEGAGTWPLLSFWYAIALKKVGMIDQADEIYRETLELLPNDYIPEQLLPSERTDRPPTPLVWAHAMFIIASKELGYY